MVEYWSPKPMVLVQIQVDVPIKNKGERGMKEVTKLMINKYKIMELGYDFMGYKLNKGDILTYHHLIIPRRNGGPMTMANGAIIQRVPHDFLHIIERYDYDAFCYLSSEMIDKNIKGHLDIENIRRIDDILTQFEREHCSTRTKKGKLLIKEEYTRRHRI